MKVDFTTRLDADLRRRLRIFAAMSEQTIEEIVRTALDSHLPPAPDMSRSDDSEAREALPAGHPGPV